MATNDFKEISNHREDEDDSGYEGDDEDNELLTEDQIYK